jgi:hypothetical protein
MKSMIRTSGTLRLLMWIAVSAILFSFLGDIGTDSYKVYLNDKLVLQQYVMRQAATIPTLPLEGAEAADELRIYYNHCGKIGTSRKISLTSDADKKKKDWSFADVNGTDTGMSFQVKDILSLGKANDKVKIIYTSNEIPDGIPLAFVATKDRKTASN